MSERYAWVLWTAPACEGRGTAGAVPVEVCDSDRYAQAGAPHHGFRQACYMHTVGPDGEFTSEEWCWDTDDRGLPSKHRDAWYCKIGYQQKHFLAGCLQYGGWYPGCGWKLQDKTRKDRLTAQRLVERGLLVAEERINRAGERFTLYRVANPKLAQLIIEHDGYIPVELLDSGEVRR